MNIPNIHIESETCGFGSRHYLVVDGKRDWDSSCLHQVESRGLAELFRHKRLYANTFVTDFLMMEAIVDFLDRRVRWWFREDVIEMAHKIEARRTGRTR
jgi:hypothetical protein